MSMNMRPNLDPGAALSAEAALWVTLARYALRLFGFRGLARTIRAGASAGTPDARLVRRIAAAVDGQAARRGQGCLPRAFAAAWMLRRRGFRPTLHYGVRREQGAMQAHVWLEVSGMPVVGQDQAAGYALLASFPPAA